MRRCIDVLRPDAVIHLGDHYDDGAAMAEQFAYTVFYQVPGNCDRYRCPPSAAPILCCSVGGVVLYMTHGHIHKVKQGIGALLADARRSGAQAALYGHTHRADCHQEPDGLWVLNPGSCGSSGGTAGVLELNNGKIVSCRIIGWEQLEECI